MESRSQKTAILGAIVALCGVYWLTGHGDRGTPDQPTLTAFLGTWTDENGPPGNYVRFSRVTRPLPATLPGIEVSEGKGQIHGLLGESDVPITWNYESYAPLRLNVIVRQRARVVPVRLIDNQHLLLRFVPTADVAVWSSDHVWDGPEVRRLTRIKDVGDQP